MYIVIFVFLLLALLMYTPQNKGHKLKVVQFHFFIYTKKTIYSRDYCIYL